MGAVDRHLQKSEDRRAIEIISQEMSIRYLDFHSKFIETGVQLWVLLTEICKNQKNNRNYPSRNEYLSFRFLCPSLLRLVSSCGFC